MSSLIEHYKTLGVNIGAGINEITASYKRLCRIHHPDVSGNPDSEELMKRINIAYSALREKFKREAAMRERQTYSRTVRRYSDQDARTISYDARAAAETRRANAEAEKEAYNILENYFMAINAFDYSGAYNCLSSYDRRQITRQSFIDWRTSVSRLYPMREFKITGGRQVTTLAFTDGRVHKARKFNIAVTEDDLANDETQSHFGDVEKLVINENGFWKVFLGYGGVGDLTKTFEEKFEEKWKQDITKRWEEYYSGIYPEYDMLSMQGLRKAASRELYRQRRYGGVMTFAAMSIRAGGIKGTGQDELLRSAAKTISRSLRETDCAAYVGDGVFAILFIELRKKNAEGIIGRLAGNIRRGAGQQLGGRAVIEFEYETWSNSNSKDFDGFNKVLKKFRKKM